MNRLNALAEKAIAWGVYVWASCYTLSILTSLKAYLKYRGCPGNSFADFWWWMR